MKNLNGLMSENFVAAFAAAELPERSSRIFQAGDHEILICHAAGGFYAVQNRCSHAESPLDQGRIRRNFISCPLHGMLFDLETGEPKGQLTRVPLTTYPVRIVEGIVEVDVGSAD